MEIKTWWDIDFAKLYRQHFQLSARQAKKPEDWQKKAEKMQHSSYDLNTDYVHEFIRRMDLNQVESLLDIGCGGGAISLALANKIPHVFAMDYCQGMLDLVEDRAQKFGIKNIQTLRHAWEEDWDNLPSCDVLVSSRSSMVADLNDAIDKLNAKAKKAVYMTMIVEKDFIARDILQAIGRDLVGFPNYLYAVNLLAQKGYYAKVDFIEASGCLTKPAPLTLEQFLQSVRWSIGELNAEETQKLKAYFNAHPGLTSAYSGFKKWAFISWQK